MSKSQMASPNVPHRIAGFLIRRRTEAGSVEPLNSMGEMVSTTERYQFMLITPLVYR
jgi:hypothetical protein